MANTIDSHVWRDFLEKYRDLPVLWKIKSEAYKNKYKKSQAWNTLLEVYQRIDPNATVSSLKNKIANIRSFYRREAKKVSDSNKSGAGEEDVYVPTLWYFECLHFLKDQEEETESICSIDLCDSDSQFPNLMPKRSRADAGKENFLKEACTYLKDVSNKKSIDAPDEADVYGKSWACSFRNMPEEQKLYAKRAIEEILILGQLGKLVFESVQFYASSERESVAFNSSSSLRVSSTFPRRQTPYKKLPMFSPRAKIHSSSKMQYTPKFFVLNQQQQQQEEYLDDFETEDSFEPQNRNYANISDLLEDDQYS